MFRVLLLVSAVLWSLPTLADSTLVQIASPESSGTSVKVDRDSLLTLIATGKPGVYTFLIITPHSGGISLRECSVTVTDKNGSPPAKPDKPTFQTKYGLERRVAEFLKDVPEAERSDARRLALAYSTAVVQMEKEQIKTVDELKTFQRESNKTLLGEKATFWTGWSQSLGSELQKLSEAGTLVTIEDHIQAWNEIARGLNGELP